MEGEEVIGASAYEFVEEVLVEVTCRDDDGDLIVYSYPFSGGDNGHVAAADPVPREHRQIVLQALEDSGYDLPSDSVA